MGRFNLSGHTVEEKGKFGCVIVLDTPDGKLTRLESGTIYRTEAEAAAALKEKLDEIIDDFTSNHEVEVVSRTEGMLQ